MANRDKLKLLKLRPLLLPVVLLAGLYTAIIQVPYVLSSPYLVCGLRVGIISISIISISIVGITKPIGRQQGRGFQNDNHPYRLVLIGRLNTHTKLGDVTMLQTGAMAVFRPANRKKVGAGLVK